MKEQKLEKILLEGGAEVVVDWLSKGKCRSCSRKIYWSTTSKGKKMPINSCCKNPRKWESHFASCPNALRHRKN